MLRKVASITAPLGSHVVSFLESRGGPRWVPRGKVTAIIGSCWCISLVPLAWLHIHVPDVHWEGRGLEGPFLLRSPSAGLTFNPSPSILGNLVG